MSATAEGLDDLRAEEPTRFWRSLEERSRSAGFLRALEREFPEISQRYALATDRRTALKLLASSLFMAGLGHVEAAERIAPYVNQPEGLVPGIPKFYASTLVENGFGFGVIVETHEGRPTKIEGNPDHPGSRGGTSPTMQASLYGLYDPTRSRSIRHGSEPSTWDAFLAEVADVREQFLAKGGSGLGIVLPPSTSPTLLRLLDELSHQMPELKFYRGSHVPKPSGPTAIADFDRAKVIVSLGGDFLGEGPARLAAAAGFANGRRVRAGKAQTMSRLYAVDVAPTLTTAAADSHRIISPSEFEGWIETLSQSLTVGQATDTLARMVTRDVSKAGPQALFVCGDRSSDYVRAKTHDLNALFGSVGTTLDYIPATPDAPGTTHSLGDLFEDLTAGAIERLFVFDCDLVHLATSDLDFAQALGSVARLYHHGLYRDASAELATWHVPALHDLEGWGDALAYDGTASIIQPMIAPLYGGKTVLEIVAALLGDFTATDRQLVRTTWQNEDEETWREALRRGVIADSASQRFSPRFEVTLAPATSRSSGIDVVLYPDPYLLEGRNAANLFLTELPRPLSKLVWGNAAEMGPQTAAALGVKDGDIVAISTERSEIELPVFIEPGHANGVVAIATGFGRQTAPDVPPVGVNANPLRSTAAPWIVPGASARKTGRVGQVITTQLYHAMEGRDLVREVALGDFGETNFPHREQPTLYPEYDNPEESWGMSIDLGSCIGCMACVAACQTVNNTPVVGPDEMARGHDMHWLRVDRYYSGDEASPETVFQPVPCMQCEDAPCEVVCPVNATVHTHDGLNAQVYNRCVGTRYCSQNCPYKVRRFNFFQYQDFDESAPLSLLLNPDVSVRERGVMEKCTYCVQRISEARIHSDSADKPLADGAVKTACQQACPTQAITFGNINDKTSAVVAEKAEPHDYRLLEELNTRPRTSYLARVTNRPAPDDDDA